MGAVSREEALLGETSEAQQGQPERSHSLSPQPHLVSVVSGALARAGGRRLIQEQHREGKVQAQQTRACARRAGAARERGRAGGVGRLQPGGVHPSSSRLL